MELWELKRYYRNIPTAGFYNPLKVKNNQLYFNDGKLDGEHIFQEGDWIYNIIKYSKGAMLSNVEYKYKFYKKEYGGGVLEKTTFVNGIKNGEYFSYEQNGNIRKKGKYKNDKQDGVWEEYYSPGKLFLKEVYIDGKLNGLHETYEFSGKLVYKGLYKDGKKEGVWEFMTDKGIRKETYKDGIKID